MKKVTVKSLQGLETHSAQFPDIDSANDWVRKQSLINAFGLTEGWYAGSRLSAEQKATAQQMKEADDYGNPMPEKMYYILDQFVVGIQDITEQLKEESLIAYSGQKVDFGHDIIKYVHYLNDKKGITSQQLFSLFSDIKFQQLKALLETGSLRTARTLIGSFDNPFYTNGDKAVLISKIEDFLRKHGESF
jgi:hypothetical protein